MNTLWLGIVLLPGVVFFQLSGCASLDERLNPGVTAGKPLHAPDNGTKEVGHLLQSDEDYDSSEYKDEYPRVAFSSKPKNFSLTEMKDQVKGKERKKNPCLKQRYRNYCVHGVCQYLAEINHTSCICEGGYSGERCHLFILPVVRETEGNSHTTALAVVAVVLSLMCLTIICVLLTLRCHKKGDCSVDEKIKLQPLHSSEENAKNTNQWLNGHDGNYLETSCQC